MSVSGNEIRRICFRRRFDPRDAERVRLQKERQITSYIRFFEELGIDDIALNACGSPATCAVDNDGTVKFSRFVRVEHANWLIRHCCEKTPKSAMVDWLRPPSLLRSVIHRST